VCADDRVKRDCLASAQPLLERARLAQRDHDREGVGPASRVEMAPADQILVVAPPCADLIRVVADESGGALLLDCLAMTGGGHRVAEHQLAADILALVIAPLGAGADVDELDGDVGALAVVSDRQPYIVVRHDPSRLRPDFVERPAVHAPAAVTVERPEIGGAVARKRLDVHLAQADRRGPVHDVRDRVVETG
jgi:hypothetical protein